MLRLIIALVVCYVLFPTMEDSNTVQTQETSIPLVDKPTVSTFDTLSAVNSVIQDVGDFCDRNEEACITGSILISNAHHVAKTTIGGLIKENENQSISSFSDKVSE